MTMQGKQKQGHCDGIVLQLDCSGVYRDHHVTMWHSSWARYTHALPGDSFLVLMLFDIIMKGMPMGEISEKGTGTFPDLTTGNESL